jgi:hypothetical protein
VLDARYEPEGQLVRQLADPADEKENCPPAMQLETRDAPSELRYVFAAQFVQVEVPDAVAYIPAPHFEHNDAPATEY